VVPKHWPENSELAGWVSKQRTDRRQGTLLTEREARLNQIGFDWDPDANAWQLRFDELVEYHRQHGHCNVPHLWEINRALGGWVAIQRRFRAQGRLKAERLKTLESIGFACHLWMNTGRNGSRSCAVSARSVGTATCPAMGTEPQVGHVGEHAAVTPAEGAVEEEKIQRLDELGLRWDPIREDWEQMFEALLAFKSTHGHCLVPDKRKEANGLSAWWRPSGARRRQAGWPRNAWAAGGGWFCLGFARAKWDIMLGSCDCSCRHRVTPGYPIMAGEPRTGWMVLHQRQLNRKGKLTPERVKQLESLGFTWEPHAATWDQRFNDLAS